MWELDHEESWGLKNWCFWTVVVEKTLESALNSKEIRPGNPKGNQSWTFIGRADAEAPILWPPDAKNWLTGKDPDAGRDWRLEEKGMTEDEMVGWHHWLNGHEFEQTPRDSDRQGSLVCCSPWGCRVKSWTRLSGWTTTMKTPFLVTPSVTIQRKFLCPPQLRGNSQNFEEDTSSCQENKNVQIFDICPVNNWN